MKPLASKPAQLQPARHLQKLQPSYIREILQAATAPGVISLAGGLPADSLFPRELLQQAMASICASITVQGDILQYGETAGYPPLLEFLNSYYQLADSHSALVCNGSQQALDLVARAFINPGDGVAMEAPCYLGAIQVFSLAQARIETVAQTAFGPDLDALEQLFACGTIKLFYAVPDFHNPTGLCWSLDARRQVAALCQRYHVVLIEDAPYRELRFSGQSLPLVSSLCPEHALLLRSFSKIAVPGIRLGVATGPKAWLDVMTKIKQASDLHTNLPMQALLLELLKAADFTKHIATVSAHYHRQYQQLASQLHQRLGDDYVFNPVDGGMFIWLQLPRGNPMEIARQALANGVAVVPSEVFYPEPHRQTGTHQPFDEPPQPAALRLNFSYAEPAQLMLAAKRLSKVLAQN